MSCIEGKSTNFGSQHGSQLSHKTQPIKSGSGDITIKESTTRIRGESICGGSRKSIRARSSGLTNQELATVQLFDTLQNDVLGVSERLDYFRTGPLGSPYDISDDAFMFSVEFGDENADEVIIMTAGYGWGTPVYLPTIADLLVSKQQIYPYIACLDWLGTGASTRVPWKDGAEAEWTTRFFTTSLHAWIIERGFQNKKITLAGHSIGAYLSGLYVQSYPGVVSSLWLLSPCGLPLIPDQFVMPELMEEYIASRPLGERLRFWVYNKMWEKELTPNKISTSLGRVISKLALSGYVKRRAGEYINTHECLKERLTQWLVECYSTTSSGDMVLHCLFHSAQHAKRPLQYIINELDVDRVDFVYGERDWMNPEDASDYIIRMGGQYGSRQYCRSPTREIGPAMMPPELYTYECDKQDVPEFRDKALVMHVCKGVGHQLTLENGHALYRLLVCKRKQVKDMEVVCAYYPTRGMAV